MDITPFAPFTGQHGFAVLVGICAGAAILMAGRRGGRPRRLAGAVLAFANLAAWPLSQFAWMGYPKSLDNILPFHLCDVAAITAGFALLSGNRLVRKLTYFWGLAATLQALLTPAIMMGFPHPPFIMFFVHHFAVVIAAVWFPVVDGWRPRRPLWRDPLHAYGWSVVYLAFAMLVNQLLGTNFAFAAAPPPNPSLIDHLGPWPWYLLPMQVLGVVFFLLLALPFRWIRGGEHERNVSPQEVAGPEC
ncbi:MAG: TIGR02206 family membrane protein [Luteolibacter sp.]